MESGTRVWLVELRKQVKSHKEMDCTVLHVASSRSKALAWAKWNLDVEAKDEGRRWWFAIYYETVDSDRPFVEAGDLFFVDWNGNETHKQPLDGYGDT